MYILICCHFRRQKCDQERSQKYFKLHRPYNNNTLYVKYKNKNYTSKNRGNWNHLKIIKKYLKTYRKNATSRNRSKQPHWALHTYLEE
jgi:hypothetical protein